MGIVNKQFRPLVSVIIPTHNRAAYLNETLNSLAAQIYRPLEVIVVDDGSTDDTSTRMRKIVQELHTEGVRCHYSKQSKSSGSHARNRGFQLSHGHYILFMDSDDFAHPRMIARMVEALEQNSADFCVCDTARFHSHPGDASEVKQFSARRHSARAHISNIALQTNFLSKRFVIDSIGPWDEEITRLQDVEYTFRVLVSGFHGIWIPEVLYYWRTHNHQLSKSPDGDALASSLLVFARMVAFAKLHNQHTWPIRIAFGQKFARLSFACNQLGYTDLAENAERYASRECPGIRIPLRLYTFVRGVLRRRGRHRNRPFA